MTRALTAILALLFTFGGSVGAPVSRIERGRDSAAIVWIDGEQAEALVVVRPPAPHRETPPVHLASRLRSHTPVHDLFQRPPPVAG